MPLTFYVAGVPHSKFLVRSAHTGVIFDLIPEPENNYDPKAILVSYNDKKVGYVPRGMTDAVRKLHATQARVLAVTFDKWEELKVEVLP